MSSHSPNHIALTQTPEESELKKKQLELEYIELQLAGMELELNTLQAEKAAFEQRYIKLVGLKLADLDQLVADIALLLARRHPHNETFEKQASGARSRAQDSHNVNNDTLMAPPVCSDFTPELKKLYRDIAKQVHPDLATNSIDRGRRSEIMKGINDAYRSGNSAEISRLFMEWMASPEAIQGVDIASELIRVIRKIAAAKNRLIALEQEIKAERSDDLHQLLAEHLVAAKTGRDLLGEMAKQIQQQIREIENTLQVLIGNIPEKQIRHE